MFLMPRSPLARMSRLPCYDLNFCVLLVMTASSQVKAPWKQKSQEPSHHDDTDLTVQFLVSKLLLMLQCSILAYLCREK